MPDAIPVFLKQKKTSPTPTADAIQRFSVQKVEKQNKPGEFYNRAKNEGEGYGAPYKVLKAEQQGEPDNHGNLSFSLLIEPLSQEGAGAVSVVGGAAPASDKEAKIDRAVAFKEASRQVAAYLPTSATKEERAAAVAAWTATLLPIVKGEPASPSPQPEAQGSNEPTGIGPQDDIPFNRSSV